MTVKKQRPKTARRIKDVSPQYRGVAYLYLLSEPVSYTGEDGDLLNTRFVVASAVIVTMGASGAETYIFPSDHNGLVKCYEALDGSLNGSLDLDRSIEGLGYHVISKPLTENEIGFSVFKTIYEDRFKPGNLVKFTKVGSLYVRFDSLFEEEDCHTAHTFSFNTIKNEDLCLLLKPIQIETRYNILILELLHVEKTHTAYADARRFSENIDELLVKVK